MANYLRSLPDGVTVSRTSGTGPATVGITITSWKGRRSRSDMVVFADSKQRTRIVDYTQEGLNVAQVIPSNLVFDKDGGVKVVTLNTNLETISATIRRGSSTSTAAIIQSMKIQDVEIPVEGNTINSYSPASDPGATGLYDVVFEIRMPENNTNDKIIETFTVGGQIITITQNEGYAAYLNLDKNTDTVTGRSGSVSVGIQSNTSYNIEIISCTSADSTSLTVTPEAIILPSQPNRMQQIEIQSSNPWLAAIRSEVAASPMSLDDCWAQINTSNASGDSELVVLYGENESDATRMATIRVTSEDGEIVRIYTLVQSVRDVYVNDRITRVFKKNDCEANEEGTEYEVIVSAGLFTSTISKEDANNQAEAYLDKNGQAIANENGACNTTIWSNDRMSRQFQRNNCEEGWEGSLVTYIVPAGKYASAISKSDANRQAEEDIELNGQNYANENGSCNQGIWYNERKVKTFYSEVCKEGFTPQPYEYVVEAGKHESIISQEDANRKADEDIEQNGQKMADQHGECFGIFYSKEISDDFERNDCTNGQYGSTVTYTVPYGAYTSNISQEDADRQAQQDLDQNGQSYANANGECSSEYRSRRMEKTLRRNDCEDDYIGTEETYIVQEGTYTSTISQEDADRQAEEDLNSNAQDYANKNGDCNPVYYNVEKSTQCEKNNCEGNTFGSTVTYIVEARKYYSLISQEDADRQADEDLSTNCQAYANENGICQDLIFNDRREREFQRNDCQSGYTGTFETYVVPEGTYSSRISKEDANNQADADLDQNGQDYANKNGDCIEDVDRDPVWEPQSSYKCADNEDDEPNTGCKYYQMFKDVNPNSNSFNETQWRDTGTTTCTSANWQSMGVSKCASGPSDSDGSGCLYYLQIKDSNPCSDTYNQTQWDYISSATVCTAGNLVWNGNWKCSSNENTTNGTGCLYYLQYTDTNSCSPNAGKGFWIRESGQDANCKTPNWMALSNYKCASSASGADGSGCQQYREYQDINACSTTGNQTEWRHAGAAGCSAATWTPYNNQFKCAGSSSGADGSGCTRYRYEIDTNKCSSTYNTDRWNNQGTCSNADSWQDTGATKCESCLCYKEQKQIANCAPTATGSTQYVRNSSCDSTCCTYPILLFSMDSSCTSLCGSQSISGTISVSGTSTGSVALGDRNISLSPGSYTISSITIRCGSSTVSSGWSLRLGSASGSTLTVGSTITLSNNTQTSLILRCN